MEEYLHTLAEYTLNVSIIYSNFQLLGIVHHAIDILTAKGTSTAATTQPPAILLLPRNTTAVRTTHNLLLCFP